jgi:hypothetical protein
MSSKEKRAPGELRPYRTSRTGEIGSVLIRVTMSQQVMDELEAIARDRDPSGQELFAQFKQSVTIVPEDGQAGLGNSPETPANEITPPDSTE